MTIPEARNATFSPSSLECIREPFAAAIRGGLLELSLIAPDVVSVATPEGDRAVLFGIDGAECHALSEAGDVLAVGNLADVVARSVERFRIL